MNLEQFPVKPLEYNDDVLRKKMVIQRALMSSSKDPMEWINDNASYFKEIVEKDPEILHYADYEITDKERKELRDMIDDYKHHLPKAA